MNSVYMKALFYIQVHQSWSYTRLSIGTCLALFQNSLLRRQQRK